jgi:hypothetical protein
MNKKRKKKRASNKIIIFLSEKKKRGMAVLSAHNWSNDRGYSILDERGTLEAHM